MKISCDCGSFKCELTGFPKNTPGRLVCYCKDCQAYVNSIGRADVLDAHGGTEVIPVYPREIQILQGQEHLKCYRLHENGIYRWATSCCNSPVLNTKPDFPWAGVLHTAYKNVDPNALNQLGDIKSRIFGRDAIDGSPHTISEKIGFKDIMTILPFVAKGKMKKMGQQSPFFEADSETPICKPEILTQ